MGDLTKNFSRAEFACKCGCGFDNISIELVASLQQIRDIVGPIKIKSGCRCLKHNRAEGGEENSDHLTGEGADVETENSRKRYDILAMAYSRFPRIGIGKTFIHLGISRKNPQDVCWLY